MAEEISNLAVFIDFENLALGFTGKDKAKFEIRRVLERLVEKGKVVSKRAYADWSRFAEYKRALHEEGIVLIEIPKRSQTGKNSADIHLCVDAMDLAWSKEHISSFVILSGDSDFSPLVSKLKENGKHVIGLGMKESTSSLLRDNCDEFIYYEDLERGKAKPVKLPRKGLTRRKQDAFTILMETIVALMRENKEVIWSSMIKDTIRRKRSSFDESYYGYRTFSQLLEDAQKHKLIVLSTDERSGTYVVSGLGKNLAAD